MVKSATSKKAAAGAGSPGDEARVRRVVFEEGRVIEVDVAQGMVTHLVLADDEQLEFPPAMGRGSDCRRPTDPWCVAATGRDIFIKPRVPFGHSNMDLVTTRRRYVFMFNVLPVDRASDATLQLNVDLPPPPPPPPAPVAKPAFSLEDFVAQVPRGPSVQDLIASRMSVLPAVRNTDYSVAEGRDSEDIVPAMVFDDGKQTYFSFPNNRPMPTVFQVSANQVEEMVNVMVRDDMLVADRVAKKFYLRLGNSVVAIVNERFDLDGVPAKNGTTVPGVARVVRTPGPYETPSTEMTQ
ncbi:TrbG/VirB9 family P-type conjugative transfer protein [Ideonella sp. DXS29W]|uniref:TrbG/VirB9 family P-type conjugative transfer protein n=1 Tax=Ideonella lacteola TaxID=2984193 RepID=A0ABU9BWY0_9BURK